MTTEPARSRLFADVYDGPIQGRHVSWGEPVGRASYLARLRLDAFLRKKIVIVDTDIVDGAFFLDAATDSLLEELPLERIEVQLRANSFEDSIYLSFFDPKMKTLRPYFLSSMSAEQALQVQSRLKEYPSSGIQSWRRIPQVLRSIGVEAELTERYAKSWAMWCELINKRRVGVGHWDADFQFEKRIRERVAREKEAIRESLTPFGQSVMDDVLVKQDSRSEIAGIIGQAWAEIEAWDVVSQNDLRIIEAWYGSVYNNTRAANHNCACVEITYTPDTPSFTPNLVIYEQFLRKLRQNSDDIAPGTFIEMPLALADGLADPGLTSDRYASLLANSSITEPLDDWHERRDFDGLRRAAERLVRELDDIAHFEDTSRISTTVVPRMRMIADALSSRSAKALTSVISAAAGGFAFIGTKAGLWDAGRDEGAAIGAAVGAAVGVTGAAVGLGLKKLGPSLGKIAQDQKLHRIVQSIIEIEKKAQRHEQE